MTADDRMTRGFIMEVLDVMERHGYLRSDDQRTGRAIGLISDLAHIYDGTPESPAGAYILEAPSSPQAEAGLSGPANEDAVVFSATEAKTLVAALDDAADYKRDRAETCADCADQSCGTCQWRLHAAQSYDHLAAKLLQTAEASSAATAQQPAPDRSPGARSQPQTTADREARHSARSPRRSSTPGSGRLSEA
jgi:hypothetical protein